MLASCAFRIIGKQSRKVTFTCNICEISLLQAMRMKKTPSRAFIAGFMIFHYLGGNNCLLSPRNSFLFGRKPITFFVCRHASVSLEMLLKLVAVFGTVVRTTVSAPPSVGVNLHAEER